MNKTSKATSHEAKNPRVMSTEQNQTPAPRTLSAVVLAAGKGTRMHSDLPKVMHEACGRP